MTGSHLLAAFLVVTLAIASNHGALGQASPPGIAGAQSQTASTPPTPSTPATPSAPLSPAGTPEQAAAEAGPLPVPAPAPTPKENATEMAMAMSPTTTTPTATPTATQSAIAGNTVQRPAPANSTGIPQAASGRGGGCQGGCIAGAVVGAVVGLAIIAVLGFFVYKWTSGSGGVGKSKSRQLDAQPYKPPSTASPPASGKLTAAPTSAAITTSTSTLPFTAGQHVSIKLPGGALPGTVVSCTSKSVEVKPNGRQVCTVKMSEVARLYQVHEKVLYVDPVSQKSRVAAIVSADGTSWPPFYRINFANETGAIDTVQSQLKPWT